MSFTYLSLHICRLHIRRYIFVTQSFYLIQGMKPALKRLLSYTKPVCFCSYYWDKKEGKICIFGRKGQYIVNFTVIFHMIYLLLQIHFTLASQEPFSDRPVALVIVAVHLLLLQVRWAF